MNFSLILFLLVLFTGIFYVLDLLVFKPKRIIATERALFGASAGGNIELHDEAERRIFYSFSISLFLIGFNYRYFILNENNSSRTSY